MFGNPFKKYQKKCRYLEEQEYNLSTKIDNLPHGADEFERASQDLKTIRDEIDTFIENEYAEYVFDYYSKKQPELIDSSSGTMVSWSDAFGNSFTRLSKDLRHALVGLVEGYGQYRIK